MTTACVTSATENGGGEVSGAAAAGREHLRRRIASRGALTLAALLALCPASPSAHASATTPAPAPAAAPAPAPPPPSAATAPSPARRMTPDELRRQYDKCLKAIRKAEDAL